MQVVYMSGVDAKTDVVENGLINSLLSISNSLSLLKDTLSSGNPEMAALVSVMDSTAENMIEKYCKYLNRSLKCFIIFAPLFFKW